MEATQNADVFVEVSGLLKTLATTLIKISGDLREAHSAAETLDALLQGFPKAP